MTQPTTYAPPAPDAVWTAFEDALPEVGTLVYVRGDSDFDPAVPYAFMEGDDGGWCPHLGARKREGRFVRNAEGYVARGDTPFQAYEDAEWTPAISAEVPAAPPPADVPAREPAPGEVWTYRGRHVVVVAFEGPWAVVCDLREDFPDLYLARTTDSGEVNVKLVRKDALEAL